MSISDHVLGKLSTTKPNREIILFRTNSGGFWAAVFITLAPNDEPDLYKKILHATSRDPDGETCEVEIPVCDIETLQFLSKLEIVQMLRSLAIVHPFSKL